jgi:hypothetical protein
MATLTGEIFLDLEEIVQRTAHTLDLLDQRRTSIIADDGTRRAIKPRVLEIRT